ncbi:MAG: iron-sulfur cluster assembly accessory protein [Fimbriimonadaceae bacterium]|nr:iron-sulfur cluster assembly accessory protein [Chthonomonadaceae bacterium]MCO5298077.1 iron-sulfur cluster assembly accessory protein [Fimbriimonadaceae bacterium]
MSTSFPVTLTDGALAQVRRLLAKDGRPDAFLRVGIKGGGCSGLEYVLKIDTRRTPFDQEARFGDILVVCDAKSAVYLQGSTLEYTGNLIGGGFQFDNPNAARSCGCGTSFTLKGKGH